MTGVPLPVDRFAAAVPVSLSFAADRAAAEETAVDAVVDAAEDDVDDVDADDDPANASFSGTTAGTIPGVHRLNGNTDDWVVDDAVSAVPATTTVFRISSMILFAVSTAAAAVSLLSNPSFGSTLVGNVSDVRSFEVTFPALLLPFFVLLLVPVDDDNNTSEFGLELVPSKAGGVAGVVVAFILFLSVKLVL